MENNYTKSILTGGEVNEAFKKMCLNCRWYNRVDGTCTNQDNLNAMVNKLKQAVSGYEIEDIKLKPIPLKDDTKKCQRHETDTESVVEYVISRMS